MSFFKRLKKVFLKTALPGIGGKIIGNKLAQDKKKDGPAGETPYDWGSELERVQKEYGGVDAETAAGEKDMAQRSGTYADTPAFQQSLKAESDAASRLKKYQLQQRANEARRNLGLPESPAGSI